MAETILTPSEAALVGVKQIVVKNLQPSGKGDRFIQLQYIPNKDGSWTEERYDQNINTLDGSGIVVNEELRPGFDPLKYAAECYEPVKCLPCSIFRDSLGDCTNGGISSAGQKLDLLTDDLYGFRTANLLRLVELEKRVVCGGKIYRDVIPVIYPGRWWMSGGNILYSSDSRFEHYTGSMYPLVIHDRYETPEEYELYSR